MASNEVMAAWLIMAASVPNDITTCYLRLPDHDKALAAQHITNAIMCNDVQRLQHGHRPLGEPEEQRDPPASKKVKTEGNPDSTRATTPGSASASNTRFLDYKGFAPLCHGDKPIDLDPKPKMSTRTHPNLNNEVDPNVVFVTNKSTIYHRKGCGKIINSAEQDVKSYQKAEVEMLFKPCSTCRP